MEHNPTSRFTMDMVSHVLPKKFGNIKHSITLAMTASYHSMEISPTPPFSFASLTKLLKNEKYMVIIKIYCRQTNVDVNVNNCYITNCKMFKGAGL